MIHHMTQIEELPSDLTRSNLGRVRAWLRLAMMQKKLPDYFRLMVDMRDQLLV